MGTEREKRLITDGSPCDLNFFDRDLLTVEQAKGSGYTCPNIRPCVEEGIPCALKYGVMMASYVVKGSNLRRELEDFARENGLYRDFHTLEQF